MRRSVVLCTLASLVPLACMAEADESPESLRGYGGGGSPGGNQAALVAAVRGEIADHGIEASPAAPSVSDELFTLGQSLAFDKELSGNRNISCLSCHHPTLASGDARALPLGEGGSGLGVDRVDGEIIPRNAPHLFNLHVYDTMFWDSRVEPDGGGGFATPAGDQLTPEMEAVFDFGVVSAQAMFPVTSPEEMRGHPGSNDLADIPGDDFTAIWETLMNRLGAIPEYVDLFEDAYPGTDFDDMTFAHAANAIAAFEIAGFEANDTPWEAFVAGDDDALSKKELRGALAFFDSGCASCHSGPGFSDFEHHNTALAQFGPGKGDGPTGTDDFGRQRVTGDADDMYRFRTATLVNVAATGPWGHDGQFKDLKQFVKHYDDPIKRLNKYKIHKHVDNEELWELELDNADDVIDALTAAFADSEVNNARRIERFLGTLTDEDSLDGADLVPDSVPSGLPVAD